MHPIFHQLYSPSYYSDIGIEWAIGCPGTPSAVHLPSPHSCTPYWLVINTIAGYYVHLLRATGLQLCRLIGPQHRRPCVRFAVASPPPTTIASMHLRHHHGTPCAPAAPSTWQPDHNYVDLGHLQHDFFDHGYCALTLGYLDIGIKGYRLA
jgi:hypothetical protein